jgi:hypothetical protein
MDIALLVNEYLKGKEELRDFENDSLNIVDNQIMEWSFANISQPTMEELEALQESVQVRMDQEAINKEALAYLASTDWMVIRAMDSGEPCPEDVKQARAEARSRIVK